jgi:hypothetical protein
MYPRPARSPASIHVEQIAERIPDDAAPAKSRIASIVNASVDPLANSLPFERVIALSRIG